MTKRKVSNPLALAVIAMLREKPMHPYEIATTLRQRHKDASIKLNYGSLYSVIESLERHRWIEPQEKEKPGNRPERTVYRLTEAGDHELSDWLGALLSQPAKEFTQFEAGLSLMTVLAPDEAMRQLEQRCRALEIERRQLDVVRDTTRAEALPKLFLIEFEFRYRLLEAELDWVRELIAEIASGRLEGLDRWKTWHEDVSARPERA